MSLFDTIYTAKDKPVVCPECNYGITAFQTKDLDPLLNDYHEGTKTLKVPQLRIAKKSERKLRLGKSLLPLLVKTGKNKYYRHPKYRAFYAYTSCPLCQKWVEQNFRFEEDGKLVRIGNPIVKD